MAEDNGGGGFPWAPLLALLTAGSGIFLLLPTLSSFRPPGGTSQMKVGNGYVKARLWQDPLEAVREAEAREAEARQNAPSPDTGIRNLRVQIEQKLFLQPATESNAPSFPWAKHKWDQFLILPVMVSGGPYEENVERRLRDRHAVLDGLHAAGFVPDESEKLGFFRIPSAGHSAEGLATPQLDAEPAAEDGETAHWLFPEACHAPDAKEPLIAFEWCYRLSSMPASDRIPWTYVLVVWLPDDVFSNQPLHQLANFFSLFACSAPDGHGKRVLNLPEIHLLGPENSGTLRSMMQEVAPSVNVGPAFPLGTRRALETTHIYACEPSASDTQLKDGFSLPSESTCKQLIEDTVKITPKEDPSPLARRFAFDRTVVPDNQIVSTMCDELERRHVQVGRSTDHIAIISELDTFYSQALQATFTTHEGKTKPISANEVEAATIHFYTYLRGIDGQLPGREGDKKERAGQEKSDGDSTDEGSAQRRKKVADTAGLDQSDYLQRLADELGSLDGRLWNDGRGGLKAVGVLGSDVYDKLEILSALRPKLPGVLFFTNFLDARLSHPESWAAAHNLLVVSSYGLQLRPKYQHGALPFRDSFQTAVFEATQEAVGGLRTAAISGKPPRIYEIGRSGPWDLSVGPQSVLSPARNDVARANFWATRPLAFSKPGADRSRIRFSRAFVTIGLAASATLFLALLSRISRATRPRSTRNRFFRPFALLLTNTGIFVPVAGFASALIVWHLYARQFWDGEPFAWFEGLSVCPSDVLRLFASFLCFHFIIKAHFKLKSNALQISNEFGLFALRVNWHKIIRRHQWKRLLLLLFGSKTVRLASFLLRVNWGKLIRRRRWRRLRSLLFGWPSLAPKTATKKTGMAVLWWEYQRRGLFPLRFTRTVLLALVFMAFTFPLVILMGHMPPPFPVRGSLILFEYGIVFWGAILSILLTFFVIDATRLHTDFIECCARYTTRWPSWTLVKYGYAKPVPPPGPGASPRPKANLFGESNIADFWDVMLIAKRTDALNVLVYYPFIFILLMMLSRIDYFDNWTWPLALIVVMALQGGLLLYHCCKLPTKARRYRDKILARLRQRYRLAVAAGRKDRAEAIESIIREVEDKLRQGAFVSLWEQPVFRAILLPSGGVGLWTLIQYLPH